MDLRELKNHHSNNKDVTLDLKVSGMSCQGCVKKVRQMVQVKDQQACVVGEPMAHRLMVRSALTLAQLEACIVDAGYQYLGLSDSTEYDHSVASIDSVNNEKSPQIQRNLASPQYYQLALIGMTCAGCVNSVKNALEGTQGAISAEVNFANHTAQVTTTSSVQALLASVEQVGYQASLILDREKVEEERQQRELAEYKHKVKSAWLGLGLGIPLMLYMLVGGKMEMTTLTQRGCWLLIGLMCLWVMLSAGKHYFHGAWKAFRSHQANMDMLIALGTGSAWCYSIMVIFVPAWLPENTHHLYFEAAVMIIGFINLGQALELRARRKTNKALHRLLDLRPKVAILVEDNKESQVDVSQIKQGDIIRLRSGDKIPVDGEVIEGASTVNESMLTGEPIAVAKYPGDPVSAGTINEQGSLLFKATHVGSATLLAQIIAMVEKAQNSKLPISMLADKVSAIFVPSVIIIAIVTALLWFNLADQSVFSYMLVTSISVLIIACPCALGLATPISTMIGIGKAAEYGGLIHHGDALQKTSEITVLILDKTGTITQGNPKVVKQTLSHPAMAAQVAKLVTALEAQANHPLASALLQHCQRDLEDTKKVVLDHCESLAGMGLKGAYQGNNYYLGNENLMEEKGIPITLHPLLSHQHHNATRVYFADDKNLISVFYIEDPIKVGAQQAIEEFKQLGLWVVMLTGDNKETAQSVATQMGIRDYQAQLMPEDKLSWIECLQARGEVVGMIGDGINDAPALAQADVGFAMGAGTDVAMESADITLMRNDLASVVDIIEMSKATLKNIKQNLWGAFTYNSLGIPIAAGVLFPFTGWLLNPVIAGVAMSLSSLTVVTNANRLRLFRTSRSKVKKQ